MHLKKIIFGILVTGLSVLSCKKFLDKKSDSTLIVPASLNDLQRILDDQITMNVSTPSFGESSNDDYFYIPLIYDAMPKGYQFFYTWRNFEYTFGNDWSRSAPAIYNSNLCLEKLNDIPKTFANEDEWNYIKGAALFFRSYYFLGLLWDYSKAYNIETANKDLGIIMRLYPDYNIPAKRKNAEDSYRQIIDDAKTASTLLPEYAVTALRPSKAAAFGLLARIFLSMRDYSNALQYADSCLNLKNDLLDYNTSEVKVSSFAPFGQFNRETIFYSEMNNSFDLSFSYNYGATDTLLFDLFEENDLRKKAFFTPLGFENYVQFKGSYTGDMNKVFSGITASEMYLIRSECYIREGNIEKGLRDLNLLLANRYLIGSTLPIEVSSMEEALNVVLLERRKELIMRGLRWMDIKRLNLENRKIILKRVVKDGVYTLEPNDNYYALPLPIDIIRLTGIQQN